ncbi:MAG: hypothetical protein ABIV06_09925, partial [Thermoanaerobaculia bacterium]
GPAALRARAPTRPKAANAAMATLSDIFASADYGDSGVIEVGNRLAPQLRLHLNCAGRSRAKERA